MATRFVHAIVPGKDRGEIAKNLRLLAEEIEKGTNDNMLADEFEFDLMETEAIDICMASLDDGVGCRYWK